MNAVRDRIEEKHLKEERMKWEVNHHVFVKPVGLTNRTDETHKTGETDHKGKELHFTSREENSN